MDPNHHRLHHHARCYGVAFGFRDVPAECDALAASASMRDYATARAPPVPFDYARAAWRRVPVLRRRETA